MWTNHAFGFFVGFGLLFGFMSGCVTNEKLRTCEEITELKREMRYDSLSKEELIHKLKMKDLLIESHQLVIDDLDKDNKANLDNARLKCEMVKKGN